MKLFTALLFDFVHRFHIDHNTPCLVPQSLHNLCLRFILGRLLHPEETENNGYAFFLSGVGWGVSKVHYGLCENGEFEMKMKCGLVITVTELNEGKWRGFVTILLDIDITKFDKSNARFAFIQWNLSLSL